MAVLSVMLHICIGTETWRKKSDCSVLLSLPPTVRSDVHFSLVLVIFHCNTGLLYPRIRLFLSVSSAHNLTISQEVPLCPWAVPSRHMTSTGLRIGETASIQDLPCSLPFLRLQDWAFLGQKLLKPWELLLIPVPGLSVSLWSLCCFTLGCLHGTA